MGRTRRYEGERFTVLKERDRYSLKQSRKPSRIVATGKPEAVAQVEGSYTGQFLRKILRTGV
jgi:hypothetical protein